jgi:hypothetical protein
MPLNQLPERDFLSVSALTPIRTISSMLFREEVGESVKRRRPVSALWEDSSK